MALGALEGGAGGGQVKRLLLLAAVGEVVHLLTDLLAVRTGEGKGGGEHNEALVSNAAVAIAQVKLVDAQVADVAGGREHADLLEDVGHAAVVGAGVHVAGAANGARDAAGKLQARKAQLAGHLGGLAQVDAGLAAHLVVLDGDAHEALQRNDDAAEARVRDQQVRAAAQKEVVLAGLTHGRDDLADLVDVFRGHKEVCGTSHLKGGVLAHWLVNQHVLLADDGAQPPREGSVTIGHVFLSLARQSAVLRRAAPAALRVYQQAARASRG